MKSNKLRLFVALALVSAALFVRLGFWQLSRRSERRARNALVKARLDSPEVDASKLSSDTAAIRFTRAIVVGTPDYDHELVYASRSYKGSPGVNLFTPVRIAGRDTAILVNRGWVYSPDGASADLAKWRERDTSFTGYIEEFPSSAGTMYTSRRGVIARLGYGAVAKNLPYPIAPFYLVMLGDSAIGPDRLARLTIPPLDEGPHLNYAIQWFCFAAIALVGVVVVIRQSRATRPSSYDGHGVGGESGARGAG